MEGMGGRGEFLGIWRFIQPGRPLREAARNGKRLRARPVGAVPPVGASSWGLLGRFPRGAGAAACPGSPVSSPAVLRRGGIALSSTAVFSSFDFFLVFFVCFDIEDRGNLSLHIKEVAKKKKSPQ